MPTDTQTLAVEAPFRNPDLQEARRREFVQSGWWVSIPLTIVPSHWLGQGEHRLDSEYYAAEVVAAMRAVHDSGFLIRGVEQLTKPIYYPGRFKRIYAKTKNDGIPFLTASEMLHFRPTSDEYLANSTSAIENCRTEPGWLLVTRSGTVGRCVLVGKRLAKFAITTMHYEYRRAPCLPGISMVICRLGLDRR